MSDRYQTFTRSPLGRLAVQRVGLPAPPRLARYDDGPIVDGPVLVGGDGAATELVEALLRDLGAPVRRSVAGDERYAGAVFDATGITDIPGLRELYEFFHPVIRGIRGSGRVVVLGVEPGADPAQAAAQQALEGFVRSVGKELKRGATATLVRVTPGAEAAAESTLRFVLSPRSAYVDGQVVAVGSAEATTVDWTAPLAGQVALVTGAARGIGAATVDVLARDGATVVCLDVPAAGDALARVANRVGGTTLQIDITAADAPDRIASALRDRHGDVDDPGAVDIVVHNAGITRDRTLGRMKDAEWDAVLGVNLQAPQRITEALLATRTLRTGGRVIFLSSMAGIAGGAGQTNYAASKAGLIGYVRSQATALADRAVTVNAVAPGFIETEMTARMPTFPREMGRRLNSLNQGGKPVDVAETIAWMATPASAGVTGQVVRVCGQHLIGA